MPIKIYISNDLQKLAEGLAFNRQPDKNVFRDEIFIVQTEGLSRWLSIKLSEKTGIFANFKFISPNEIIYDIYKICRLNVSDVFDEANLKWLVYDILGNKEFSDQFPEVAKYYEVEKIKRYQFAAVIANLLDQYTFFRQDFIENWNQNADLPLKEKFAFHEKWQRWIWRKIKELLGEEIPDKVEVMNDLFGLVEKDESIRAKIKDKYDNVSFFGFSSLSSYHIRLIAEVLNPLCNITFYLFNPSPTEYWYHDIPEKTKLKIERYYKKNPLGLNLEVGNQLLMDMGKTIRYFYLMLFNYDEFLNSLDNESLISDISKDSLLHIVQSEILNNLKDIDRLPIERKTIADKSIQISSHFSLAREIEALHDYLLYLFDKCGYVPGEVIVQMPAIDDYVPYIKAIFDNYKPSIPYSIADRTFDGSDNLIGILKEILTLQDDEFTSENVIQFCEYEPIRRKFGFNGQENLRELIRNANIRTGIEGRIADETHIVSWKAGLERIIFGYAMQIEEPIRSLMDNNDILPAEGIEGEMAIEAFKLVEFADILIRYIENRKSNRSLKEWQKFIVELMENLFFIFDTEIDNLNLIYNKLIVDDKIDQITGKDISYEVFSSSLLESIYQNPRKGNFISGSVTFCSMMPMRSIPYRAVCLLGLNHNTFPRKNKEISFDLMQETHRAGDRNNKETDKFLFLEALLSSRDKFYVSYIGKDIKSNTELPPSSVVEELLDYIFKKCDDKSTAESFIIKHPLHSYNSQYFIGNEYLFTYRKPFNIIQKTNYISENKTIAKKTTNMDIESLINFYKNPIKWYFNKNLEIFLNENDVLIEESEKFSLDKLSKSIIKKLLFYDEQLDLKQYIRTEKIRGSLPLGNMAEIEIAQLEDELNVWRDIFKQFTGNNGMIEKEIKIKLVGFENIGYKVGNIYGDKMILVNFSSDIGKGETEFKILRAIMSLYDKNISRYIYIFKKEKEVKYEEKLPLDIPQATNFLSDVIQYYLYGSNNLSIFYPSACKAVIPTLRNVNDPIAWAEKYFDKLKELNDFDEYKEKIIEKIDEQKIKDQIIKNDHNIIELIKDFFED